MLETEVRPGGHISRKVSMPRQGRSFIVPTPLSSGTTMTLSQPTSTLKSRAAAHRTIYSMLDGEARVKELKQKERVCRCRSGPSPHR